MLALERETVHTLLLPRRAQPDTDEHHVVHDRRAGGDVASEVEASEERTRRGIEGPQLTRAVAHEEHTGRDPSRPEAEHIAHRRRTLPRDGAVRGVEGEDVRRPGEGGGVDLPERDPRRRAESAAYPARHHRLLPDESAGVRIDS